MAIPIKLVSAFRKARLFAIDHEAGLEIGAGITCFAVSVVCAAKAAIKSKQIMEEYNEGAIRISATEHEGVAYKLDEDKQQMMVQYTSEDAKKDMGKLKRHTVGKLILTWTPCALGFAAGTGLVLRSHHVMVKSNLGLAAALKTAEVTFDDYRKRVANKYGENAENDLYNGVETVEKKVKKKDKDGKTVTETVIEKKRTSYPISPYARIFGPDDVKRNADWCKSSNDYNIDRVKSLERWTDIRVQSVGKCSMREVADAFGFIERIDPLTGESLDGDYDVVGWKAKWAGGKTGPGDVHFKIIEHLLDSDPNAVNYVHDDWTDSMVRAADPFFVDFNVEGCILEPSTIKKLGGRS